MNYARITVDDITYTLIQSEIGSWTVTDKTPLNEEDYIITLTVSTDSGQDIVININDDELLKTLTLLSKDGTTNSGNRMLNYYPYVVKIIKEIQAIMLAEGFEVDFLITDIDMVVNEAYLLTMGKDRIKQWEEKLGLTPTIDETIEDRREKIIAFIRGSGKLNTTSINAIVASFTNGTATSYVADSTLFVKIKPPPNNKQYKFANVEEALKKRIPAHLGLVISRDYATWGEIATNFDSWESVSQMENWESVKLYVAP